MMGMDKMLSSMVGMSPEEMKAAASNIQTAIIETAENMKVIRANTETIMKRLERLENGKGK